MTAAPSALEASAVTLRDKCVMVTGGAGFIGSHLVDRLADESPKRVVVVDDLFLGNEGNLKQAREKLGDSLRTHWQDASDQEAMRRILDKEQVDVVYNLAVIPLPASLERPAWTVARNMSLTTVICELLREDMFQTVIHFSSSEAYGTAQYVPIDENHPLIPTTPYAASKVGGDHVALSYQRTFGIDVAVLRPFNTFGPRQNDGTYAGVVPIVINRVLDGLPIEVHGDGEQTRDFLFVRDTVEAAVQIYREPSTRGLVINVASGQEYSVNFLIRVLLRALNAERHEVVRMPTRQGDVRRHVGGINRARHLLSFEPRIDIEQGLKETVDWYVEKRKIAHAR